MKLVSSFGSNLLRFMGYIRGNLLAMIRRILSTGLLKGLKNCKKSKEPNENYGNQYQKWIASGGRLTSYQTRQIRSRRLPILLRPYLEEKQAKQGLDSGALILLVIAAGIFYVWGGGMARTLGMLKGTPYNGMVVDTTGIKLTPTKDTVKVLQDLVTGIQAQPTQIIIVQVQYPTLEPTRMPTTTPSIPPQVTEITGFKYSYYYPPLGGINCADYDFVSNECVSNMADGTAWQDGVGHAVACDVRYPFGTVVRVLSPAELAGDWICQDRGSAIIYPYIDFLHEPPNRVEWNFPIVAEVIYPTGWSR
jgi:hypothetical protein